MSLATSEISVRFSPKQQRFLQKFIQKSSFTAFAPISKELGDLQKKFQAVNQERTRAYATG